MVVMVWGLPGSGKTTLLARTARRALKKKRLYVGHGKWKKSMGEFDTYERVFSNVPIFGTFQLNTAFLGIYDFSYSLLLIDEALLQKGFDSRKFSEYPDELRNFMALHRHYHCDILLFSQNYNDVDKRVRNLTERLFYLDRAGSFTRIRPIDKGVSIDEQINEGYYMAPPLSSTWFWRKPYYKYFNSYEAPQLPENPAPFWDVAEPPAFSFRSWIKKLLPAWLPCSDRHEKESVSLPDPDRVGTDNR